MVLILWQKFRLALLMVVLHIKNMYVSKTQGLRETIWRTYRTSKRPLFSLMEVWGTYRILSINEISWLNQSSDNRVSTRKCKEIWEYLLFQKENMTYARWANKKGGNQNSPPNWQFSSEYDDTSAECFEYLFC